MPWSKRDLTIYGRVHIIKTFVISYVVQVASLLPIPNGFETKLNRYIFNFLWKGKDKIQRVKQFKPYKEGGINMVDVDCMFKSLKAIWLYRIMEANITTDSWAQLAYYFLKRFENPKHILGFSLNKNTICSVVHDMHPFYKEVVLCYSYSNKNTHEKFCLNLHNQPLWGHRFVCVKNRNKNTVLFLRNWIRSGINKISDLRFQNDGKLDEAYVYDIIQSKINIHMEILMVKKALEPYSQLLRNDTIEHVNDGSNVHKVNSKQLYLKLEVEKCASIQSKDMCANLSTICHEIGISENDVFQRQLCKNIETKLKEFNFKVLHGILPCNDNLLKWKIKDSNACDICNSKHTIEHLLFGCHRAVHLWECFESVYRIKINYNYIVCGIETGDKHIPVIVMLLGFLLYKEWLVNSLENQRRSNNFPYHYFIYELQLRNRIYCTNGKNINIYPLIEYLQKEID